MSVLIDCMAVSALLMCKIKMGRKEIIEYCPERERLKKLGLRLEAKSRFGIKFSASSIVLSTLS